MSKEKDNISNTKGLEGSDETMCDLNRMATINIKGYLDSFLGTVRQNGDTDVELLILSVAGKVGYSLTDNYFQYSLGSKEIDLMVTESEQVYNEFQLLRNSEAFRRKAFILLTALSEENDLITLSEVQKRNHFMAMVNKMGPSLSQEILELLEKHSEYKHCEALRKDLKCLISGDYKNTDKQNMESIVRGIKSVCQPFTPQGLQELNVPSSGKQQPDTEVVQDVKTSQEFSSLLERLGLKDYFPRKLNKKDLHVFSISSMKPPVNETELPMCFLQMLMTLDYRCRYLVCEEAKEVNTTLPEFSATEHISETFSTIEAFFSNCSIGEVSASLVSKEKIHPMDLLMAICHCADDFMRQYIFNKLSVCQFALPFIFPCFDISGLEMPLWSFRQIQKSILYIDEHEAKKHKEKPVCEIEVPLVSFTRVGTSSFSKSQILNNLLNKHNHDIFFHRNCKGSGRNSILKEGLVEIVWFCPGGKDDDQFERCTSFVNLHGDAGLQNQQATFLHEIASINVILYSDSGNNDMGKKMFQDMLKSEKPLICLCPDKEPSPVDHSKTKVVIGLKNQNEATFMDVLETTLRRMLSLNIKPINLNSCANVARKFGFQVDEDKEECKKGKEHAQKLKSSFMETTKDSLLPLSRKLWHTWCKKDKALTRLQKNTGNIEQHKSQIEREKKNIRYEQLQKATENDFMKSFITSLRSLSQSEKLFFLQWLKIFIDELSYDRILELQDQYNQLWSQLQTQNNASCTVRNKLLEDMEMLTEKLNNCMLGLEHILREVGQTYEALYEMQLKDDCFYELPKIAADIMISGYPIELMDGDASYVPLNWIGAVLTELIKIIGDRRVFVLSVLGIQSSGKSTLLNTMFGLQFAVSAGRCTRGAFMQLIEVDEKHKADMAFDYILVIDTEGLRSMELANHSTLNHDNELATFVIGVSNMTLINVYGENPSEIKDILQIAVQAFLRMKKVKLTASCLFVHQNVGEITALDKNKEGRMKLQKELDNMTVLAAEQEHCNARCFSDVIQFNAMAHIYYFAHLWEGNPPMAPPNPSYSKNAQEVRNLILQTGRKESQSRILKISELKVRIEDLWLALRNENFVFSFKNTLEISAYRKVESNYSQWTWQLRRHVLELETKLNNRIKQGKLTSLEDKDLRDPVKCKFDAITEDLERFFTYDKDMEILIPWKSSVENRMRNLLTELLQETKQHVVEHLKLKQGQNQIKNNKYYEDELFQKSKQLALSLKKMVLDSDELERNFNTLWQKWVAEINLTSPAVESPNIKADMVNILYEYFQQEPSILDKLNDNSKQNTFSIDFPTHVTLKTGWRGITNKKLTEIDKSNINNMPIHLVSKIKELVQTIKTQNLDYNQVHFHEIIHHVIDTMESTSKDAKNFTLTKTLKVDLSIFLCHMALPYFEAIHKDFQKSSNPVTILEGKRKEFFNCFIISYQGATSIKIFADFLCCKLIETMRSAVYERAALAIVDDMKCNYPDFSGSRSKLETHILKDLAEQEDFEKYRQYLHFPDKFFESYIENCVSEYCLSKDSQRLKGFLNISLGYFQKLVLSAIADSTQLIKDKRGKISEWLDEFYKRIEDEVSFSRDDLKSIEHQEIQDIEFIQEALCKAWDAAIESFKHELKYKSFDAFEKKPHSILTKQLCGCWEQCPFCKAICTNTIPGHDGDHCVAFHRSQALSGIHWEHSVEFVTEICSTLVMSDAHIIISDTKQIPYKKYREVGPNYANWSITPDTSSQPYWKWFVHHFRSNLENDYGLKFEGRGAIPVQWEEIEKDEVMSNLKEYM
ncbi:interferon-induced very large GTPase 1-like [Xenopus laevis]|nr:interferon-induced very large GTPase 1-like [Xenopus laevis]